MDFDYSSETITPDNTGILSIGGSALELPSGNTASRPSGAVGGAIRWNSETLSMEYYSGSAWAGFSGSGSVTSVNASGGTTGMVFSGGPITSSGSLVLSGTLIPANGGTGLTALGSPNRVLGVNAAGTSAEYKAISAGTGISVANTAGTITINNTGVTSVALSLPSIFNVTGSPITTTGAFIGTLSIQSPNTVFAGPATGVDLAPTFRTLALATNDISDVLVTSVQPGQVLRWDGADWVNSGGYGSGGTTRTWGGNITSTSGTTVITPGVTAPLVTAGTQLMTQTITPPSTTARYRITFNVSASASTNNNAHTAALFRNSTYIGGAIQTFSSGGNSATVAFNIIDQPNTTSPVTYSIRYGTSANTWYINRRMVENTYGGVRSGWSIDEF